VTVVVRHIMAENLGAVIWQSRAMWHRIVFILLLMDLPLLILPIDGGCDENHDGYLFPHSETSRFWVSGQPMSFASGMARFRRATAGSTA
jgi:hypothetical protein